MAEAAAAESARPWSVTGATQHVLARIGTLGAGGVRVARVLWELRVARIGDNMRHVAVTDGDKVEAQMRLGFAVDGYGIGDLVDAIDAVPARAVDRADRRLRATLQARRALREGGARREALRDAARIEAILRGVPG